MSDLERLAEAVRADISAMEGRLSSKIDGAFLELKETIHRVGGEMAVANDKTKAVALGARAAAAHCAEQLTGVEADLQALTDKFLPKPENERRLRDLEKARDDIRGRFDDFEHRLTAVQSAAGA